MKKMNFSRYVLYLGTVSLLAVSCGDGKYTPGDESNYLGVNVYFEETEPYRSLPLDVYEITFRLERDDAPREDENVPLHFSCAFPEAFDVPEYAFFPRGEMTSEVTVYFTDKIEDFKEYRLSLYVDEAYTQQYIQQTTYPRIDVTIVREDYEVLRTGRYICGAAALDLVDWGEDVISRTVDLEYSRTLDEGLYGARAEQEIVLDVYTQFWEGYASLNETYCIAKSVEKPGHIICWLDSDQALEREVQLLCKTDKYISGPNRGETASQKRILRDRQAENAERRKNIGEMLKKLFCEAKFFSTGAHVSVPGADKGRPSAVQDYILADMVRNLYNKFAFLKSLQPSDEACRKKVRNLLESGLAGGDTDSDNAQALKEMEQYLQLQNMACVTVQDLQDRFGKRPYGWPEWEIILLSVRLVRAAKVQILGGGAADIDNTTLADQLLKVQGWKSLLVRLRRKLPDATVRRARIIYQNLTGRLAGEKAEDVVQVLRDLLKTWSTPLARYENLLSGGNYPGGTILSYCRELFTRLLGIRDDATFLENIVSCETDLEDARDGRIMSHDARAAPLFSILRLVAAQRAAGRYGRGAEGERAHQGGGRHRCPRARRGSRA